MTELRTEKSRLRRVIEVVFYVWGLFGMAVGLFVAHQVMGVQPSTYEQQIVLTNWILAAILHVLIWIGGLVFLGLLALLAPVKTILPGSIGTTTT
jgi:hypothetical protein